MSSKNRKVSIAIPCFGGNLDYRTVESILFAQAFCIKQDIEIDFQFMAGAALLPEARNLMADNFMKSDSTHLLFLDSDVSFEPITFVKCINANKDFVISPYPGKCIYWDELRRRISVSKNPDEVKTSREGLGYHVRMSKEKQMVKNGFVEMDRGPTGFMLLTKKVFKVIQDKFPELKYTQAYSMNMQVIPKDIYGYFDMMSDEKGQRMGEDFSFCARWKEAGGRIYAYIMNDMGHHGRHSFTGKYLDILKHGD